MLQVVPREFCLGSLASVAGGPGVFQPSKGPGVTLLKLLCNNVPPHFCPFPPCAGSADVSDLTELQKQEGKSPWSPWLWGLIVLA